MPNYLIIRMIFITLIIDILPIFNVIETLILLILIIISIVHFILGPSLISTHSCEQVHHFVDIIFLITFYISF